MVNRGDLGRFTILPMIMKKSRREIGDERRLGLVLLLGPEQPLFYRVIVRATIKGKFRQRTGKAMPSNPSFRSHFCAEHAGGQVGELAVKHPDGLHDFFLQFEDALPIMYPVQFNFN